MDNNSERMEVHIFTRQFKLIGFINIYSGVRLTDYMNESKPFVSITNVKGYDFNGEALFAAGFLNLRRDEIVIIIPSDQLTQ